MIPQFQLQHRLTRNRPCINAGKPKAELSDTFKKINKGYASVSGHLKPEGWNYELGYKHITHKDSWKVAPSIWTLRTSSPLGSSDSNGRATIRVNGGRYRNVGIEACMVIN